MTDLYVATSRSGLEHGRDGEVAWNLPDDDGHPAETAAPAGLLVLRRPAGLLDVLDEAIWRVEPVGGTPGASEETVTAARARIVGPTAWGAKPAAHFALGCVEHALSEPSDVELPDGVTLGQVLAEARRLLEGAAPEGGGLLARLSRLAAARRLRKRAEEIGDVAFAAFREDLAEELEATSDPAWMTITAYADAVLAAVEALRSLALPHYVADREEVIEEAEEPRPVPLPLVVTTTPWGPIAIGAEHQPAYIPTSTAAREAALHAREALRERFGDERAEAERQYQAGLLASLL